MYIQIKYIDIKWVYIYRQIKYIDIKWVFIYRQIKYVDLIMTYHEKTNKVHISNNDQTN